MANVDGGTRALRGHDLRSNDVSSFGPFFFLVFCNVSGMSIDSLQTIKFRLTAISDDLIDGIAHEIKMKKNTYTIHEAAINHKFDAMTDDKKITGRLRINEPYQSVGHSHWRNVLIYNLLNLENALLFCLLHSLSNFSNQWSIRFHTQIFEWQIITSISSIQTKKKMISSIDSRKWNDKISHDSK